MHPGSKRIRHCQNFLFCGDIWEMIAGASRQRSPMTNGAILPGMGRSAWVRRLKDLVALHIADLGGDANVSEAERAIVRRTAVIITELERMEKNFALSEGAPGISELETYQRMANTMRRPWAYSGVRAT
jgi:hypothetical protein